MGEEGPGLELIFIVGSSVDSSVGSTVGPLAANDGPL